MYTYLGGAVIFVQSYQFCYLLTIHRSVERSNQGSFCFFYVYYNVEINLSTEVLYILIVTHFVVNSDLVVLVFRTFYFIVFTLLC